MEGNGVSRTMLEAGDISTGVTPDPTQERDVWAVPDTPRK